MALLLSSDALAQTSNQSRAAEAVPTVSIDLTPLSTSPSKLGTSTSPPNGILGSEFAVEYLCAETIAKTNQVKPHLRIANHGGNEVALSDLTARYWFLTSDKEPYKVWCDWAQVGAENVKGRFVRLDPPRRGANSYLEISFEPAAGKIAPQSDSGECQIRFSNQSWGNFDQAGDYSFNAAQSRFAESPKITLYRRGKIVWGAEPSK